MGFPKVARRHDHRAADCDKDGGNEKGRPAVETALVFEALHEKSVMTG
jgi:hypothetical protein